MPKSEPRRQLLELLRTEHAGDAGIVYCLSRASVEQTAEFLTGNGITALPYHAGLDARTRTANQARFLREDGMAMVATIAFGMGIDKPDVRYVGPPRPAQVRRGLLPGDRPGLAATACRHRLARLRPRRCRAAAQADRHLRGRRGAPPPS